MAVWQSVLGYRFTKKWSVQWQNSSDFFARNVKYSDNSLGVEFRQNLNNAGYPPFLGISIGMVDKKYSGAYQIREQAILPQLSLSKRVSKYITLELFTNYALPVHSNNTRDFNNYPQAGINFYIF